MTLESWATAQADRLIGALGDRWTHVQAVADTARSLATVLPAEDADLLVAAALLHDVGYAPSLNRLGFHAVDGARFLRAQGHERLARLVAHHSGARFEAEERGLVEELAAFPVEDGQVMDALTFADMTTGPAGQPMTLAQRIEEVQGRYRSDDPVHRAIVRARPELLVASWPPQVVIEAVERGGVEAKLDPGSVDRILQVQQAQPDPGGKAIADAFLLSPAGTPRSVSPSTAMATCIRTRIRRSGTAWTRCMSSPRHAGPHPLTDQRRARRAAHSWKAHLNRRRPGHELVVWLVGVTGLEPVTSSL
jgi:putative nucleotidyltransferase with HDIG domain